MAFSQNLNQGGIKFLPETRKFKLIRAIPRNDEIKYSNFKNYIEIEHILFQNSPSKSKEELFNQIVSFIEQNKDEQNKLFGYLIDLLIYFTIIRPKIPEIPWFLIASLQSKYKNKQNYIQDRIKTFKYSNKNMLFIYDLICTQEFNQIDNDQLNSIQLSSYLSSETLDLGVIIMEDNADNLKDYINSHNDFSDKIVINLKYPLSHKFKHLKILDFCSYYGSINCFKFLYLNGYKYGRCIKEASICGANLEIIHEIEQSGISYDFCFEYSIKYHQRTINEWLLSNYRCELFTLTDCLIFYDYEAFLYLFLNNVNVNRGMIKPLFYLLKQREIDMNIVYFLLEHGANVNKESFYNNGNMYTPLGYFLKQKEIDMKMISFLCEHGADVNKECIEINRNSYTPLGCILEEKEVDIGMINFLLDHGADINKECINNNGNKYAPLGYFLKQKEIDMNMINFLLEHGADVNKECINEDGDMYTPLGYFLKQKEIDMRMINFLFDHGADINKPCKSYDEDFDEIWYYTPLYYLCQQDKPNIELIKLFIEYGADVNKIGHFTLSFRDNSKYRYYLTSLCFLINQTPMNIELIELLINYGIDVNQDSKFFSKTITPLNSLIRQKPINMTTIII